MNKIGRLADFGGFMHQRHVTPDIIEHPVMSFADAWKDRQDFEGFEAELKQHRRAAFKSKRQDAAGTD